MERTKEEKLTVLSEVFLHPRIHYSKVQEDYTVAVCVRGPKALVKVREVKLDRGKAKICVPARSAVIKIKLNMCASELTDSNQC